MVEDAMALYKFSNLWPKFDESLLAQMKAEEKMLAEEDGKVQDWAVAFCTFLKLKGEDLSITNCWLNDFLSSREFPFLNLALTRLIARWQFKHIEGVNPVLQDELSQAVSDFEDAMSELEDEEQALNLVDDMTSMLFSVSDHLEIGRRLGMDDFALGVYDALMGFFSESFNPRYVDAAKSLTEWLRGQMEKGKTVTLETLGSQISTLGERFNLISPVSKYAANYILMDILPEVKAR